MRFFVNGRRHDVDAPPLKRLLDVLREDCGLTGTKEGCGEGECGACTVLLDGQPVNACLILALQADGKEVVTIEGLTPEGSLSLLQEKFLSQGAVQCGFCTPGMVVTCHALLLENPSPSEAEVREALSGNLCRCTGYQKIVDAVLATAKVMEETGLSASAPAVALPAWAGK
jgi:aerobic-type carbon monoxide dehydrogenase small subunit (CoxS/CutS family)